MTTPDDLRKRLEALNRGALPARKRPKADETEQSPKPTRNKSASGGPQAIVYKRDAFAAQGRPARQPSAVGAHIVLEDATAGVEVQAQPYGKAYRIETLLSHLEGSWAPLSAAFQDALLNAASGLCERLAHACGPERVQPEDVIFVDIETTGLSSSPLFLIGTMAWSGSELTVRQFFARSYAEEAAILALYHEAAADKKLLVSFNGKSYDVPYIRMRSAAAATPFTTPSAHFDLLHASRRVWRHRLPDCRLQTLERFVCQRARQDDIPGSEIPDAYHAYVRSNNAVQMVEVLKHNLLDLVTLADLMTRMPKMD